MASTTTPPARRLRVGLTGGIGSGKSLVAARLEQLGAQVVDTDAIAHQISAAGKPGARAVARIFGDDFLSANGHINRARLRTHVLTHPEERARLDDALHPLILAASLAQLEHAPAQAPYQVLVVPLLAEKPAFAQTLDRIVVVDCSTEQQMTRVMDRNGWPRSQVEAIMAAQASREQRLKIADDVICNDRDLAYLHQQTDALHWKCLQLSRPKNSDGKCL